MPSHILKIAARHLLAPLLLISLITLWRGHNHPGGGFIGGLVAAAAFILYNVAYGVEKTTRLIKIDSRIFIAVGLAVAAFSALLSFFFSYPLMTSLWADIHVPLLGHVHLGTPQLFDVGVYLVVFGVMLTIVLALSEEIN